MTKIPDEIKEKVDKFDKVQIKKFFMAKKVLKSQKTDKLGENIHSTCHK